MPTSGNEVADRNAGLGEKQRGGPEYSDEEVVMHALKRLLLGCALFLAGCHGSTPVRTVAGGNAETGKRLIGNYGCGSCHVIPGIRGAAGMVGPPLTSFARRTYIAGEVANNADFLVRWIEVPQAIEPGTAMPNLGITEGQARHIAAYLYTLR
jgi:cytochrome c2